MKPISRIISSLKSGILLGAAYFLSDAFGAFLAIGQLFDPKPETFLLMGVAALFTIGPAMLLSLIWSHTLGRYLVLAEFQKSTKSALFIALMVGVSVLGYGLRVSRVQSTAQSVAAVGAESPVPVLWIVIDTLRADTLYGDDLSFPHAPSLKQLANDSHVFTDAEASAGWTLPSVATLLTGIHPTTLYSARGYLPNWAPTAAQRLKRAGYQTHAFMDNYLLERRNGFASGFDTFFQKSALRFAFTFPGFRLIPTRLRETLREEFEIFYYGGKGLTDSAIDKMQAMGPATPFYYVHYMDVHYPYYEHPEVSPDPVGVEPVQLHYAMEAARQTGATPNSAQMKFLMHRYEGELKALDPNIGRLLEHWDKKFGQESLIVVTSDHGEEFLEHGELGHGNSLYKELVHVPLIIRLPLSLRAEVKPRADSTAVGIVDILPTTLDVLGISAVPDTDFLGVQGESLLPWMQGTAPAPARGIYATQNRHQRRIYRWRTQDHAYINRYDHKGKKAPVGRSELYNKAQDYDEQDDLFKTSPQIATDSQKALSKFVEEQEKDRDPKPVTTEANIDAMKALGYIE
ncbi:MAG: sulfatase-like hydrolase/transferase [Deltaproteobacteria bacterium]|nr:sulfatase-like hydrolase/transferase [Deltaproteobacteria bacterium]MBT6434828.1 sulfatase-like hydrolase/transferase [Deltaproteobacteria bacterium]MBT6488914.1 sulfatase-like hydrolase/transferase [Deltaproteobacteria bacterium]